MFFTKEFVVGELLETRELVSQLHDKMINEDDRGIFEQTNEGETLMKVLFKLDVIRNAVKNVHTN